MKLIKVLVVDDSAFMRKMITEILESDPSITVVDTARNGQDGIDKALALSPDVVTMDVEMPIMNGLDTLKNLMQKKPIPTIMLSSLTQEGATSTIQALELGAVDFISKPSGPISLDINKLSKEIIEKVKNAAKANLEAFNNVSDYHFEPLVNISITQGKYENRKKIVAIGVSTGGPRALQKLLTGLPADFPAPIVIVQHMPAGFTKSLANRLNKLSDITVKEAEQGEFLVNGTAYIAPGNYHLQVRKLGTSLTAYLEQSEPLKGHRPSVDLMFNSIATLTNYQKNLIILTGMGSDGVIGLRRNKNQDPRVRIFAESKDSAIVYGMPKAAVDTNCVDYIVHIEEMSRALCQSMQS